MNEQDRIDALERRADMQEQRVRIRASTASNVIPFPPPQPGT